MLISRKCLNVHCNNYEKACKDNFKECNNCAYLFKTSIIDYLKSFGLRGLNVVLISILVIAVLAGGIMFFKNQNDRNKIKNEAIAANPTIAVIKPTPKIAATEKAVDKSILPETVLRIHGSNTMGSGLMPLLLQKYLEKKGYVKINTIKGSKPNEERIEFKLSDEEENIYAFEIFSHGSSTAFTDLQSGACDIGMTTRKISNDEVTALKSAGRGDLSNLNSEIIFALDGISVIVNRSNPIESLSAEQISDIFSGKITNWAQLGGMDSKIKVISGDDNSGTYYTFKNLILNGKELSKEAVRIESVKDLTTEVSKDVNSIGFVGFSKNGDTKPVSILQGTSAPMYPTVFNIATEDYYMSRRLYLYCPENLNNTYAKEFIGFVTAEDGQNIIKENGLASINIEVDENYKPTRNPVFQNKIAQQKYDQIASSAQGRLSVNFLFKLGSSELDNKSIRDLERVINFLYRNKYLDSKILLVGYSDNVGDYNSNIRLSEERANFVKKSIINQFKLLDGRVDVLGMGPEMPISSNETSGGRDKNRRVEVYIVKK